MSFLDSREKSAPSGIGKSVARREDARLLTGRGQYAADFHLPGQAFAYVLRSPHAHAKIGRRPIFVDARNGMAPADIYDFGKLLPGNAVLGPAVIHTPITTIVLQDRQRGTMDGYRNIVIEFAPRQPAR